MILSPKSIEKPSPLHFKFNESYSQEKSSTSVSPTLKIDQETKTISPTVRLESDSLISPTLKIDSKLNNLSPTMKIPNEIEETSPNFDEEREDMRRVENSNVSLDLSDSNPSRPISPTLRIDSVMLDDNLDDETSSDLSDHTGEKSPIFDDEVKPKENMEKLNLNLDDTDIDTDVDLSPRNSEKDKLEVDDDDIELSPIFDNEKEKEKEKKLIEKIDHFNSDTDVELTPKFSLDLNKTAERKQKKKKKKKFNLKKKKKI